MSEGVFATETYLLTLLSRLKEVDAVIIMVVEKGGRVHHHQANYGDVHVATLAGNIEVIKHDIISRGLVWSATNPDGTPAEGD